ncbi:TPA: hypothetical protein L4I37_005058 [Pseudomonas aeruginosa]|uniref:Uncharacterized protein n=2 Tax=Ectopseudomonas TaxID=3236654 RepID=A0A1G6Q8N3_9GAMM|nr:MULTISPECIES: hypothetical protein [Pseudomonas]ALN21716.1 hypothetical protein DW68_023835 [Pseudomonas mendocina S5.2]KER98217.1 hypothetical protein HN51_25900 [Pseudomonas mendocina]MBP3062112.1 hypothetical protein [Pseudomonas chengduensis]NNB75404.1 hypothetical protein [Pseudomonas chengduensis]OEO24345.1 hypothetical protein AX279_16875 [Pseudomonas sp. J237]
MQYERTPLFPGEIGIYPAGDSSLHAAEAFGVQGALRWKALPEHDARAAAAIHACLQAGRSFDSAGARRDIRKETVQSWAANLAVQFVERGMEASVAGSYGSTYANMLAGLSVDLALKKAIDLGFEPNVPNAGEMERMATVAARERLSSAIVRLAEIKQAYAHGAAAKCAEQLCVLQEQYPQLRKPQGFAVQAFVAGQITPVEQRFSTFEEAVQAFRQLPAASNPRLCEDDQLLISHNQTESGPPLHFRDGQVQSAYVDALIEGTGALVISSNLGASQSQQVVGLLPGAAEQLRRSISAVNESVAYTEVLPSEQRQHAPRLG